MRILIAGGRGMLATDLARLSRERGHDIVAIDRDELDIVDAIAVTQALGLYAPEVLINCAAFTDVDGAETNEAEATLINGVGAGNLARAAMSAGVRMVHVGSDYVFPGDVPSPRRESDPVGPRSAYARSKLAGDEAVAAACPRALIVRSAWLYGAHGKNFVDTIRKKAGEPGASLTVVDDQIGSPTWTVSLATGILELLDTDYAGVVHVANRGALSWCELARAIVTELGLDVAVVATTTEQIGRPAARPAYSALDTTLYEKLTGRAPLTVRTALGRYLGGRSHERDSAAERTGSASGS